MQELARAKVNLSLHITGKRQDGYHLLDSIVVFPDFGDFLQLRESGFEISGPFAKGLSTTHNLVLSAAKLMGVQAGFLLQKNLPVASGIGGGSADAAAAMRLLAKSRGLKLPNAASLGADVPACLVSKPLRMRGVGEQLDLLPNLPDFAIVLVNSGEAVSTPQVFAALTEVNNQASPPLLAELNQADFFAFIAAQRNDMQAAAVGVCPSIQSVLESLKAVDSCQLARMSGSGGTCFGLFKTLEAAQEAAANIKQKNPSWWAVAARV